MHIFLFHAMKEDELSMAMTALYHIWLARNNARDEPMVEDPEKTVSRILSLVDEWKDLNRVNNVKEAKHVANWCPPREGWHKANADGAFSTADRSGGGGVIVRDHHGIPITGSSYFFPIVSDPKRAELLACRRAVQLAKEGGVLKLALETDCLGAVAKLTSKELDMSIHGPLVEDIKKMLGEFEACSINHVRRPGNVVSTSFSKRGLCK
jgi:ribonuclease HI